MVTDGFGDVEPVFGPGHDRGPSAGPALMTYGIRRGRWFPIRSKTRRGGYIAVRPESSARNAFFGQSDIFPHAERRPDQCLFDRACFDSCPLMHSRVAMRKSIQLPGLASCYVLAALIKAPGALSARRWDGAMMDMNQVS